MIKNLFLCLFCCCALVTYADDDDQKMGEAINKAGFQRMLTQRLAKSYLAVLTKTNMHIHVKQIELDIQSFEKNYADIKKIRFIAGAVLKDIKNAEKAWLEYKNMIRTAVTIEGAVAVLGANTEVLKKCNAVVQSLEQQSKKMGIDSRLKANYGELAYLTNISGRQRMLSQRIMLYYLAHRLKIGGKDITIELNKAIELYGMSLNELVGSLENTPEIDFKLVRLVNDWKKLEVLCKNLDQLSDQELAEVLAMGDLLLSEMDLVTKMYEDLIDTHIASLMVGNAINKAGRQRMLTQKMAKAYFAMTLDINKKEHQKELTESKVLFAKSLEELKRYSPIPEVMDALEQVDYLWQDYDALTNEMTNMEANAQKILVQNTQILRACHNVVLMLKIYAKGMGTNARFDNNLVSLIDKSGRQRMLSQRMVLYCMASSWENKDETVDKYLSETVEDYGKALNDLIRSNRNTNVINNRLTQVKENWQTIESLCSEGYVGGTERMVSISNQLLTDMDEITGMYEQIIARLMDSEAINKAGRQRMLTQRIALGAIAINMNLDVTIRQQQLKKDVNLFSRQLDELKIYIGNGAAKPEINRVMTLWKDYKTLVVGKLDDQAVEELVKKNTVLLEACHKVVLKIIDNGKRVDSRIADLINIAGRQRMLSQRITLHALAYRKGFQKDLCKTVLEDAIADYKAALSKMQRSSANTPDVYTILDKLEQLIGRLNGYIQDIDNVDLYQILISSNILLSEAESLTKAYETLGRGSNQQN